MNWPWRMPRDLPWATPYPLPRDTSDALLAEGFSQADLARELGVTRQAIQKMVAVGQERPQR